MTTPRSLPRYALVGFLAFVVLIQFVRPARTNPASDPTLELPARVYVPPDVADMLTRSCRDCHSHDTNWPWYSRVAPVSWLVVHDVNEGREHLNFSTWADMNRGDQHEALQDICKQVRRGDMPVGLYVNMHAEAALTKADVDRLCTWTERSIAALGRAER